MNDFEDQEKVEEPLSIISHAGRNYDSGHYVAYVQNQENKYILYNDTFNAICTNLFKNKYFDVCGMMGKSNQT